MCFRISIVFFFLMISQTSFAVKCENLILDDFNFSYEGNEVQVSLRDETKQRLDVEFVKNKNSTNIAGVIQVKNNEKFLCFEKEIDIPPIKLCRDASNDIAPWRFVTYGETDILSVVALTATVEDTAVLYNSRICKTARVEGRSYVHNSYLEAGILIGADNDEVDGGEPELPRGPGRDPRVPPFPQIPKKINYDYFTIKMSNVEITGNPIISGWKNGIFIRNYKITGSPMIFDELALDGKRTDGQNIIEGNGTYSGEAFLRSLSRIPYILVPIITDDLIGDDNEIEGSFFIERKIKNSIIQGEYSRLPNGDVDVVAHISPHNTTFEESEFKGFGHVGGEVRIDSFIHGSYVGPSTHGVLFMSGLLMNRARLLGAFYAEGLTNNDAEIYGDYAGPASKDTMQIKGSTITRSQVYGNGVIYGSFLYETLVTGTPTIIGADLAFSTISCNAIVEGVHNWLIAGCQYGHDFFKPQEVSLEINEITKRLLTKFILKSKKIESEKKVHNIQAMGLLNKSIEARGRL